MIRIPLTQNKYALIDDEDYPLVSQYKWWAHRAGRRWYAVSAWRDVEAKRQRPLNMHRLIMDAQPGQEVDHKEHYEDYIDNRKSNLRLCTRAENSHNFRKTLKLTSSQYKGVCWDKCFKKWGVQICVNGKINWVGYFTNEDEAARAYNTVALMYHGEFARLNTIGGTI